MHQAVARSVIRPVVRPVGDVSHDLHLQSLAMIGGTCKRAITNTPVRPDGDHPRPYGDRTATRKCTRSPANVNTMREKVSKNYKLKQSCVLTAFLLRPERSYHVFTARPSRPLPAYGVYFEIYGLGNSDRNVFTTRLLRVSRVHGDLRAFLPCSHGDYLLSRTIFPEIFRGSLCSHTAQ